MASFAKTLVVLGWYFGFFVFFVLPVKPRGPDSQFLSPLEIRAAVAQHERERERERERHMLSMIILISGRIFF